jgi:GH24 family phage-related lysozyme (muramidase)
MEVKAQEAVPYNAEALNSMRRLYERQGMISSTKNLTTFESSEDYEDPAKYVDDLYHEAAERHGWSVHDTKDRAYKQERFEFISGLEGYRTKVYKDTKGIATIGYGFNLEDQANRRLAKRVLGWDDREYSKVLSGNRSISKQEAQTLFDAAVAEAERYVRSKTQGLKLSKHEHLALVSLAYNNPSLLGRDLMKALKTKDRKAAIQEILYKSNRSKSEGLAHRRYMEASMFVGMADAQSVLPSLDEYLSNY